MAEANIEYHEVPLTVDFDAEWDPDNKCWEFNIDSVKAGEVDIMELLYQSQIEDIEELLTEVLNEYEVDDYDPNDKLED